MRQGLRLAIAAALGAALAACGVHDPAGPLTMQGTGSGSATGTGTGSPTGTGKPPTVKVTDTALDQRAVAILAAKCASCHGPESQGEGGFKSAMDAVSLVDNGVIVPGNPGRSELFHAVQNDKMPPGSPLSKADSKTLQSWIWAIAKE